MKRRAAQGPAVTFSMALNSQSRRLLFAAGAAAWTLAIPFLSLAPPALMPELGLLSFIPHLDKWVHGAMYGAQTFLLIGAWRSFRPGSRPRAWLGLALASALYGLLMELLQLTLTNCRHFSWADAAANAAGALLALGLAVLCFGAAAAPRSDVSSTSWGRRRFL